MQRPSHKRQIIKTRPQRPYVIARVIILLLVLAALVAASVAFERRQHALHAAQTLRLCPTRNAWDPTAGAAFCRPEIGMVLFPATALVRMLAPGE